MVLRRGNRRETSFSFRLTEAPISRFTVTGLQSHTLSLFRNGTSTRPAHGHSIILLFFAYFERFLSIFARFVDPRIVDLKSGLNCSAESVIYFQRISVIVSDLCLLYGVDRLTKRLEPIKQNLICALVIWSPRLLIVDLIHFRYNGFLLGWLLLSNSFMQEDRDLLGGFLFAVLLCFKHLFAVAAPVYFVYLIRHYCWSGLATGFRRLVTISAVVVAVFAAAYGPFIYHGQIQQVISRMFPFGRGLCHAYWAPNFWVFYIIIDKGLSFFLRRLGFDIQIPSASFTGGLVGDSSPFEILPQEYLIKVVLLLLHSMVMWLGFAAQYTVDKTQKKESGESRARLGLDVLRRAI